MIILSINIRGLAGGGEEELCEGAGEEGASGFFSHPRN
jgi:hypothetical protein